MTPAEGPDHEIDVEQQYVDRLYVILDAQRDAAAAALDAARRQPIIATPAGRAERDAFDAWHTARVKRLAAVEERLCFGRLDLTGHETRYVGRIGLSDETQTPLLLDWRAPASAAFYQATSLEPDGVIRRRQLALVDRKVTSIDDEVLDPLALDDANLGTVTGEGALLTALTARRTGQMRDIVATLQAEQDAVVRAPLPGVLVVQGGPGTGKTAVALHRAAYLLYTYRERIARSGALVVGPSPVFLRYIEQVLPSLGETGVLLSTPGQLFPGVSTSLTETPDVAVVKGDLRMIEVIRNAVRQRQRDVPSDIPIDLDGDVVKLRPSVVASARARARSGGRPHNEARTTFVQQVLESLAKQLANARKVELDEDHRADLYAELRSSVDVRREINLRWMPLTPEGLLRSLFANPSRLAAATAGVLSKAEASLLAREADAPWTISDVPLLDEAGELIGDPVPDAADAARASAAARERAESIRHASEVLANAPQDPEMLNASDLLTAEMLVDRFAENGPEYSLAERARDDRTWTFGHAVVDEAQELSPMMWHLLTRRVPSRSMTVVGDVAQTGSAAGASSWAQMLDPVADGRWELRELTVNYRTPARIMAVADALLAAHHIAGTPANAAREGDHAPTAVALAPDAPIEDVAAAAIRSIRDDDASVPGGRYAVVVPRDGYEKLPALVASARTEAESSLADRAVVVTVDEAKGLEFDGVTVVDPAAVIAASPRGVNDLYVALTRPTQRLTVLHRQNLPPALTPYFP